MMTIPRSTTVAILAVLTLCGASAPATAQIKAPAIEWQRTFGGTRDDGANAVAATTDGGCIVAGYTASDDGDIRSRRGATGTRDGLVMKFDQSGALVWERVLGGTNEDFFYSVAVTADGGCIVAGGTESTDGDAAGSNHGNYDYLVVKLDAAGKTMWSHCYGGTADDIAYSISPTFDGGYIIGGYALSNDGDVNGSNGAGAYDHYWLVRLDGQGQKIWNRSFGGSTGAGTYTVRQTSDRGFIIGGYSFKTDGDVTDNHGGWDYWVIKLDALGGILWHKSYGGQGEDVAHVITSTNDGGYMITGSSRSTDGEATTNTDGVHGDFWTVKLGPNGELLWSTASGGADSEAATAIAPTDDGGYAVFGSSYSTDRDATDHHGPAGRSDFWVVQLDSTGNVIWHKSFGGALNDYGAGIAALGNGSFYIVGSTESNDGDVSFNRGRSDAWVVKLSSVHIAVADSLSFGKLVCEPSADRAIYVHNPAVAGVLTIDSISVTNPAYVVLQPQFFPVTVQPGDSVKFLIRFTPARPGVANATLRLITTGGQSSTTPFFIALTGSSQSSGVAISVDTVRFDTLCVGSERYVQFNIRAFGTVPDTLYTTRLSSGSNAFEWRNPATPAILDTGSSTPGTIYFLPPDTGRFEGFFDIQTEPCARVFRIVVTGYAKMAAMEASVNEFDFGINAECLGPRDTVLVIHNSGSQDDTINVVAPIDIQVQSPMPRRIRPGESDTLHLRFNPRLVDQAIDDTMLIVGSPCGLSAPVRVRGTFHSIKFLAQTFAFGPLHVTDTLCRTTWLVNHNAMPVRVVKIVTTPGTSTELTMTTPALPAIINPGDSIPIGLCYIAADTVPLVAGIVAVVDTPCVDTARITVTGFGTRCVTRATLALPVVSANVGDSVSITVGIVASSGFTVCGGSTFDWRLRYDRSLLVPLDGYPSIDSSGQEILSITSTRTDTIGAVATLHFIATLGDTDRTLLHIDAPVWRDGDVVTAMRDGTFTLANICRQGGSRYVTIGTPPTLAQNSPNPFSGATSFSFHVAERGSATLQISDVLGRIVRTVFTAELAPGDYTRTFDAAGVPSGAYVATLRTPTTIRRVTVVKE